MSMRRRPVRVPVVSVRLVMAVGSTVVVSVWRLLIDVAEDARKGVLRGVGRASTVDLHVCHLEKDLMRMVVVKLQCSSSSADRITKGCSIAHSGKEKYIGT